MMHHQTTENLERRAQLWQNKKMNDAIFGVRNNERIPKMAYKSRKAGKRNRKSGGSKHFNKVGVKTVVKPEQKVAQEK